MKRKTTLTAEQKEKAYYKKLLTVIRNHFSQRSPHAIAYRAAKKTKNSEGLDVYECAHCRCYFARSHIDLDHIVPVGKSPETLEELVQAVRNTITNNLQLLCKICHKRKTKEDNAQIKRLNAHKLKAVS